MYSTVLNHHHLSPFRQPLGLPTLAFAQITSSLILVDSNGHVSQVHTEGQSCKAIQTTILYSYVCMLDKENCTAVHVHTCHCLSQSKIKGIVPNQAPSNTKPTSKIYCLSEFDSFLQNSNVEASLLAYTKTLYLMPRSNTHCLPT